MISRRKARSATAAAATSAICAVARPEIDDVAREARATQSVVTIEIGKSDLGVARVAGDPRGARLGGDEEAGMADHLAIEATLRGSVGEERTGGGDIDAGGERGIDDRQLEGFSRAVHGIAALEGEAAGRGTLGGALDPSALFGDPPKRL